MTNRGVLIEKYFANYPDESMYDNDAEIDERFDVMDECIRELRNQAVANRSIKELQELQSIEHDRALLGMLIKQKRAMRELLAGAKK